MHHTVTWGPDPDDITITTSGVVVVEELDAMMQDVVAEARWHDGMKVLLDHRQSDWSVLGSGDLDARADLVEAISHKIGSAQVAFVVSGRLNQEIGKMLGARIDGVQFTAKAF